MMAPRAPVSSLATHEVTNQPPPQGDIDPYLDDPSLREALHREGAGWAEEAVSALAAESGTERVRELGHLANKHVPELHTHDRFGRRIDEVAFHPGYHELMALAIRHRVPSIAWTEARPGGHVAHAAMQYVLTQAEAGICCPMAMNYAAIPALAHNPALAAAWKTGLLSTEYDPRCIPAGEKSGLTVGMAMTEKQGGSDVRTNTTRAERSGDSPDTYVLTGHKWFCSAPMSDGFLTLAQSEKGLTCFFVPRWRPDGTRNAFLIQRLKDKLGNRSNASSEVEYHNTHAVLVGEEGRGVATIIEMVHLTRLDATAAPAGMMRQAVSMAVHHARYRTAFQRKLIDQPLMRNVLADLVLESEAATALAMRVARAVDEAPRVEGARLLARTAVAAAKYWINKRLPNLVYEVMECHGGAGYVEESHLPRLYREAPLNSIWEGSGNVICLDVLRALAREPAAGDAFIAEAETARGANRLLDVALDRLKDALTPGSVGEEGARRLTETMALALQGSLLVRFAPSAVADAFCATRLGDAGGRTFGAFAAAVDHDAIIGRMVPVYLP
jgi:putative acyl-CoA dehydrogenase